MSTSQNRRIPLGELPGRVYRRLQRMRYGQSDYAEISRVPAIPRTLEGILRISLFREGAQNASPSAQPLLHTAEWVPGPDYDGMEDNDLRGYLDGYVKCAWNQPSQIHVRLGRATGKPTFGEWELFRVLHRWDGLWLPPAAVVEEARIEVQVEKAAESELDVMIYAVHKDWTPGCGGRELNNTSLPSPGEVWWNEVGFEGRTWGLPGAGLASDEHPDADTPVMPLACARYRPGDRSLVFRSDELIRYVEDRIRARKPLLLLLKLSDYLEDVPGLMLQLYSANHGDDRNLSRRPRLVVKWRSAAETAGCERRVLLEHGRALSLAPLVASEADAFAVSFEALEGEELAPSLYSRTGEGFPWMRITRPRPLNQESVEVRLHAVHDPVPIGSAFVASLRDTWVRTGPPEGQRVPWTFEAPSGQVHTVPAEYVGDHTWRVRFVPDALGRWRYRWSQKFISAPYESAPGYFDVVPAGRDSIEEALAALGKQIESCGLPPRAPRAERFGSTFARLERALMEHATPRTFGSQTDDEDPPEMRRLLDRVREALWGGPPRRFF